MNEIDLNDDDVISMQPAFSLINMPTFKLSQFIQKLAGELANRANNNEMRQSIDAHLKVAEKQADNISELTKLVATQANTVATLIGRSG